MQKRYITSDAAGRATLEAGRYHPRGTSSEPVARACYRARTDTPCPHWRALLGVSQATVYGLVQPLGAKRSGRPGQLVNIRRILKFC